MTLYKSLQLKRIVALVAAFCFFALSQAAAQDVADPKIGIVDVQRVLRDAKASKGILPQFEKLRNEFQTKVRDQERKLRDAERELAQQRAILAPEAFAQKRREFSEQARQIQQAVQQRRRDLDQAFNATRNLILKNMLIVTQGLAEERKLNMVMDGKFVFISAKSLDITDEVIARLDKRLPVVAIQFEKKDQGASQGKK